MVHVVCLNGPHINIYYIGVVVGARMLEWGMEAMEVFTRLGGGERGVSGSVMGGKVFNN